MQNMEEVFKFKSELWIPLYTGLKAKTLKEFIEILRKVDIESVFYHIYVNLFNYHNIPVYYPNSFSYWLYKNNFLTLAERVCAIDPFEFEDLEEVRKKILDILEKYYPYDHKRELTPFYFVKAEREIIDCGIEARDLKEFIEGIKQASINSLFYHLITSKIQKRTPINDYSAWLLQKGERIKANKILQIDIPNHTLYEIKQKILKILEEK